MMKSKHWYLFSFNFYSSALFVDFRNSLVMLLSLRVVLVSITLVCCHFQLILCPVPYINPELLPNKTKKNADLSQEA